MNRLKIVTFQTFRTRSQKKTERILW